MERIELSNAAFEGDNNAYLFDDGPETVLVDTGDWLDATREQLAAALADRGLGFEDIDRIFLTHWHGDHTGLASAIQAESDATVYIHSADAPLVAGEADAWEAMASQQESSFEHWNMPEAEQAVLFDLMEGVPYMENPPTVTPIEGGETFSVNGQTLRAVHAPGHAAGLCMYEVVEEGVALTGDALLPKYTPNVGGADIRVEQPLAKYLDTLQAIVEAEYDRALPGHRQPIEDPAARAEHIIRHHEERSWRVLDCLSRLGPTDTWTVSADLFGELESIHILHGPGESYAHLEHLEAAGLVAHDGSQYDLTPAGNSRLDELSEERLPLR